MRLLPNNKPLDSATTAIVREYVSRRGERGAADRLCVSRGTIRGIMAEKPIHLSISVCVRAMLGLPVREEVLNESDMAELDGAQ